MLIVIRFDSPTISFNNLNNKVRVSVELPPGAPSCESCDTHRRDRPI